MSDFIYSGNELNIFSNCKNWKNYYKYNIRRYINDGLTLEIGAGIGEITRTLRPISPNYEWVCVEPDKGNCLKIKQLIRNGILDSRVEVYEGLAESYFSNSSL